MLSVLFVVLGILFLIFALSLGTRLIRKIEDKKVKRMWFVLILLVCFFLLGYVGYLVILFEAPKNLSTESVLISTIFFFGAIFVLGVFENALLLVRTVQQKSQSVEEINKKLQIQSDELQANEAELVKTKVLLEKRNAELEKTLDDFYTIRLGMAREMSEGKLTEENERIKMRLQEIKEKKD